MTCPPPPRRLFGRTLPPHGWRWVQKHEQVPAHAWRLGIDDVYDRPDTLRDVGRECDGPSWDPQGNGHGFIVHVDGEVVS